MDLPPKLIADADFELQEEEFLGNHGEFLAEFIAV